MGPAETIPDETIVAPASAHGRSGRAVIRISGPGTPAILDSLCEGAPTRRGVAPARLRLSGSRRLPVIVLRYEAPASYTGEDGAELLLPGNPAVVDRVLALLTTQPGARLALPGEFTARAYFAGRLSLDQAEGVGAVIAAGTHEELAAARRLLDGRTGGLYRAWADELTTLLALVEAGIDFTDQEDVVAIEPGVLRARLTDLHGAMTVHAGARAGAERRDATPRVVLCGRPNAGKSTLFNALLGRTRAVTGAAAGTTRDVLEEELDLSPDAPGAGRVTIIDVAGLTSDAHGAIERGAQAASAAAVRDADVVLWCDPTGRFEGAPPGAAGESRPVIRVRTFADRPGAGGDIAVCGLDGWNTSALRRTIADAAHSSRDAAAGVLVSRHGRALSDAAAQISAAASLAAEGRSAEPGLIALHLRSALDSLGELVGRIDPDEVLGRVFASFCIGK